MEDDGGVRGQYDGSMRARIVCLCELGHGGYISPVCTCHRQQGTDGGWQSAAKLVRALESAAPVLQACLAAPVVGSRACMLGRLPSTSLAEYRVSHPSAAPEYSATRRLIGQYITPASNGADADGAARAIDIGASGIEAVPPINRRTTPRRKRGCARRSNLGIEGVG